MTGTVEALSQSVEAISDPQGGYCSAQAAIDNFERNAIKSGVDACIAFLTSKFDKSGCQDSLEAALALVTGKNEIIKLALE